MKSLRLEPTRSLLLEYIKETEDIFSDALKKFDKNSFCKIYPNLDLGFPHDVIRLAGGFPTGCLVQWCCDVPFIPIDTTVNVCTSSVFRLSDDICDSISAQTFTRFHDNIDSSSYTANFNRGNHFISFCKSIDGDSFLILHSSASEFKKQFNGLFPTGCNWYSANVKIHNYKSRYIRYISGTSAEHFRKQAKSIELFNSIRHDFFAETLIDNKCSITSSNHYHHYYMPTDQSVMIGGFLLDDQESAPIFTKPGMPILIYKATASNKNAVKLGGTTKYLVPHGWGKVSRIAPDIKISLEKNMLYLNNIEFSIESASSFRNHPDLELRSFSIEPSHDLNYLSEIAEYCDGNCVNLLYQSLSYNKNGFTDWRL